MAKGKHIAPDARSGRVSWGIVGLVFGLFLAMSFPAGAGSWEDKVTGGGWASAGGTDFSLTMAASDVGGQWQYATADGTVVAHGTIENLVVAADLSSAYMMGPVTHVSAGATFTEGEYWTIAVLEGGDGSGDKVRICETSICGDGGGSYPGLYYDGNINIRAK